MSSSARSTSSAGGAPPQGQADAEPFEVDTVTDLRQRAAATGDANPGYLAGTTHRVYIGETDDLAGRLDNHNRNKDFWNRAVVFTSKDANLNKAHIRYLEGRLIVLGKLANRAELENGNVGSMQRLSEPDTAEAEAFLTEMLLIYPDPKCYHVYA